ncbi:beta-1,3-N-acetylglucosaminyltransferase [Candidatus Termititenax persephonae]|uniref:Beta-1,3-N-acetylglucosaminyltransferase n=1 Tax=Candidatus Termititenax persephonae TaxID=2218525 RepID=A0A388TEL4_9BACT|nr:beta-1,3-N-acetylglucosaminyltransferase [Candidatus Termititenax persephonae]
MVNDGSTDGTERIAKHYVDLDKRVKVFSQENSGQSAARNASMAQATGDYLHFVDADDYLLAMDYYEKLLWYAMHIDADLVGGNVVCENNFSLQTQIGHSQAIIGVNFREKLYTHRPLIKKKLLDKHNIVWDTTFKIGYREDMFFYLQCYYYADKSVCLPDVFYFYRENKKSVTRIQRDKATMDYLQKSNQYYTEKMFEFSREHGIYDDVYNYYVPIPLPQKSLRKRYIYKFWKILLITKEVIGDTIRYYLFGKIPLLTCTRKMF